MGKRMTVRDVAKEYPEIKLFNYKWSDGDNPAVYLSDVLEERGYRFKYESDYEEQSMYNDIQGYYEVEVEYL